MSIDDEVDAIAVHQEVRHKSPAKVAAAKKSKKMVKGKRTMLSPSPMPDPEAVGRESTHGMCSGGCEVNCKVHVEPETSHRVVQVFSDFATAKRRESPRVFTPQSTSPIDNVPVPTLRLRDGTHMEENKGRTVEYSETFRNVASASPFSQDQLKSGNPRPSSSRVGNYPELDYSENVHYVAAGSSPSPRVFDEFSEGYEVRREQLQNQTQ